MRNLNKFITGTNYKTYVTEGNVATVEYKNVIVKVVRDSVNEYEVTFNRNDRTYSYKCQSQKEVISIIENDVAYHDSEVREVAYRRKYYKMNKKPSYKINSNAEDGMVGRIIMMGGTINALHNNWSDTRGYKLTKIIRRVI